MTRTQGWISLLLLQIASVAAAKEAIINSRGEIEMPETPGIDASEYSYGVDVSWPMHYPRVSREKEETLGRPVQELYDKYIAGCQQQARTCGDYESDRLEMNLLQPSAMRNYTHAGFAKVPAPAVVRDLLLEFWNANQGMEVQELWDSGNTYVNHWEVPTHMLDVGRSDLPGMSHSIRWEIVRHVKSVLEAWTHQSLVLTSLYGIRTYKEGAILAPHVDRLPLVSSAIINVAQDVDEPWILEVIGHDGKANNVTMEPGQMVLYESHSVIHGRPFPLKGRHFSSIFVHFEPLGHTLRHVQNNAYGSDVAVPANIKEAYEKAMHFQQQGAEERDMAPTPAMPSYVSAQQEVKWRQQYEFEKEERISPKPTKTTLGLIAVHSAAADGDIGALKEIALKNRSELFKKDLNGWRPLHEAARGGRYEVVEYLLKEGAQINERTNDDIGASPLWWAERKPEQNKKAIEVLKKYGAVSLAPKVNEKKSAKEKKLKHQKYK